MQGDFLKGPSYPCPAMSISVRIPAARMAAAILTHIGFYEWKERYGVKKALKLSGVVSSSRVYI